jgi:hypothetical protein
MARPKLHSNILSGTNLPSEVILTGDVHAAIWYVAAPSCISLKRFLLYSFYSIKDLDGDV